jgi:hypothetical protein
MELPSSWSPSEALRGTEPPTVASMQRGWGIYPGEVKGMKRSLVLLVALALISGCFLRLHPPREEEPASGETYQFVSIAVDSSTFIEISMSGGHMYGGANPTSHSYEIQGDGTAVYRTESMYTKNRIVEYEMPRERLEALARSIISEGFFEMHSLYDCDHNNAACERRKRHYPPAVPLMLNVTIDDVSKTVEVTVFERGMIDYPDGLQAIVDEIRGIFSID